MLIKYKLIFLVILTSFISCQKDDFCTKEVVTPKLIIKLERVGKVLPDSLTVWGANKDSLFTKTTLDSISVPLNPSKSITTYNFSIKRDSISALKFSYKTEEEFLSRSCGYGIIFKNIKVNEETMKNSWIDSISTSEIPSIKNQKNAHITIYF